MTAYLKIENPGVCPIEGFTVLGATSKSDNSAPGTIGCFGSGNKHAISVLLRHDIDPIVFCGKLRLEFSSKKQAFSDGITEDEMRRVVVKYSGQTEDGRSKTATEDLGFALEYGRQDWDDVGMALREFVSNALDMSIKYNTHTGKKTTHSWDGTEVQIVDESRVRAKAGTTRIFIPLIEPIYKFHENLGRWFLHFSEPDNLDATVLPKTCRNFGENRTAVIYRRGVFVREVAGVKASLFDYNLNNLRLDEARKVDDYTVRGQAAVALAAAEPERLAEVISSNDFWEHEFDKYYLCPESWRDTPAEIERRSKNWQKALDSLGENAVLCLGDSHAMEFVSRKGYVPHVTSASINDAAQHYGCKTSISIIGEMEQKGIEVRDATPTLIQALDWVWEKLEALNETNGKEKPPIKCFHKLSEASQYNFGMYWRGTILINEELDGDSFVLFQTLWEESAHHITGSVDCSRDLQDWAFKCCVKAAKMVNW
jgi:hypothetical protein